MDDGILNRKSNRYGMFHCYGSCRCTLSDAWVLDSVESPPLHEAGVPEFSNADHQLQSKLTVSSYSE